MKEKILDFIKKHPIIMGITVAALVALLVSAIMTAVLFSVLEPNTADGKDGESNISESAKTAPINWGEGITAGVPAFSGNCTSVEGSESHAVAYYADVTGEQVAEYTKILEQQCGVYFAEEVYPRSAVWGDKIIVIHYNVTEMKMSVTIVTN